MTVYAESSAVLSWLLGESRGTEVKNVLEEADFVVTSDLTFVECDRALHRAYTLGQLSEDRFVLLRKEVQDLASRWIRMGLGEEVLARAREPFPGDPIRALDALHLASAEVIANSLPDVVLLTFDIRVGLCCEAMGLKLALPLSPAPER